MFVLVVGGGKVGYYLTKELIESGHEVALMEKDRGAREPDRRRDRLDRDRPGRLRGQVPRPRPAPTAPTSSPPSPATTRTTSSSARWRSTTSTCRGRSPGSTTPRTSALFRHLGVDEIVSPDPDDPGLDRAGHPGPRAAPPGGARRRRARAHRGAARRGLAGDRPVAARPGAPRRLLALRRHPRRRRPCRSGADTILARATRSSRSAGRSARPALHEPADRRRHRRRPLSSGLDRARRSRPFREHRARRRAPRRRPPGADRAAIRAASVAPTSGAGDRCRR